MTTSTENVPTLKLKIIFGDLLMTRSLAIELRDRILAQGLKKVEVDFAQIEFAGRAFCDELLKVQKLLKEKSIEVVFINMPTTVRQMLDLAASPRYYP